MITFIQAPTIPYNWMVQRPQQIMKELSRHNQLVYYVDQTLQNEVLKKEDNLYVVGRKFLFSKISRKNPIVLWCSSPVQVLNIKHIPYDYIVYDVVDDDCEEFTNWHNYTELMLSKADIVFVASEKLYEKYSTLHPKVYFVSNGVEVKNFNREVYKRPIDIPGGKKIVGYVGAIASWINWDLIEFITENSNYNFVFVGANLNKVKIPNLGEHVYFLGHKKYEELPDYINFFDCCIVPFKVNNMTNACNPIKLFEYFALGKAVVSTDILAAKKYKDLCYICASKYEFKTMIDKVIGENDKCISEKRRKLASENDWKIKADYLLEVLNEELRDDKYKS